MKNSARNTLILVGRIGKDAEKMELENGKTVIKFTLATSNNYINQDGEKVERVEIGMTARFGRTLTKQESLIISRRVPWLV